MKSPENAYTNLSGILSPKFTQVHPSPPKPAGSVSYSFTDHSEMTNDKFIHEMAWDDHSYYPLRFLASDYFVPYWAQFAADGFTDAQTKMIQNAARSCVEDFMGDDSMYWLIDFSQQKAEVIWNSFIKKIASLEINIQNQVKAICLNLIVSTTETVNTDFFVALITRLRFDVAYRQSVGYSNEDVLILDAAYESAYSKTLDQDCIKNNWLSSDSYWDVKLKSQTPDLPESVFLIFLAAYERRNDLPIFFDNIKSLIESKDERISFLNRLKNLFGTEAPNASIELPQLFVENL